MQEPNVTPSQQQPVDDPAAAAAPPVPSQVKPPHANTQEDGGVQSAFFAVYIGGAPDAGGKPVGLFRVTDDSDAKALAMERLTPTGEWADDPALIDDLREPSVYPVDEQTADEIASQIVGSAPDAAVASAPATQ